MFVEKFKRAQILVDSNKFLRSLQYSRGGKLDLY